MIEGPGTESRRRAYLIGCGVLSLILLAAFLMLNVLGLTIWA